MNELSSHRKTWGWFKCVLISERSQCEEKPYVLHGSNYMTLWKSQNYEESTGIRGREIEIGRHRGFLGQWKDSDTVLVGVHIIVNLSKSMECIIPRISANVNYGLRVKMMPQCRSSAVTDEPLWEGILIMGEIMYRWGCVGISMPSAWFCYKPRTYIK